MVSNSIVEKSIARSWISSCTWSTVISCIRLKYGMACSINANPPRSVPRTRIWVVADLGWQGHGLQAFPIRQRAQGGVCGQQIVKVGGSRTALTGDDDRPVNRDVSNLRMAVE